MKREEGGKRRNNFFRKTRRAKRIAEETNMPVNFVANSLRRLAEVTVTPRKGFQEVIGLARGNPAMEVLEGDEEIFVYLQTGEVKSIER